MRLDNGGDRVSFLGFRCMRFPKTEDGRIDGAQAMKMLDTAIKAGVNYTDTAYSYHGGTSEPLVGRAPSGYSRDQFFLVTKLPVRGADSAQDAQELFGEQLGRLQAKYVDYYLLHALNRERWDKLIRSDVIPRTEQLKREGKIRHLGFSFHGDYEMFREVATYKRQDFCQIRYNYTDRGVRAGDRGYALAEEMGILMTVMEPIKGSILVGLPKETGDVFRAADLDATCASWTLRWAGGRPNAKTILSGMSSPEQVEDDLRPSSPFVPLDEEEEQVANQAAQTIRSRTKNNCTACRYCMPYPAGVGIPGNFATWDRGNVHDIEEKARKVSREKQEAGAGVEACTKCGKHESVCLQGIHIRKDLGTLTGEFGMDRVKEEALKRVDPCLEIR